MKKVFLVSLLLCLCVMRAEQGQAYVLFPPAGSAPVRWNLGANSSIVQNGRVIYNLNPAGSDNVAFAEVERAIASSFQTWENVRDSTIAFTRGPNSSQRGKQNDGLFQVYWSESNSDAEFADITGALAVTFVTYRATGDLIDSSLVFNGNEYCWTTSGNTNCVDIAEVATHEIGHAIGLSHSSVAAATMFTRTGEGFTRSRTLSADDAIAASVLYPVNDLATRTGNLVGTVRDNAGAAIFGANVVVSDANGNVIASALSQQDGSYRVGGLPAGNYSVFAEPIDGDQNSDITQFYGTDDLPSYYASIVTNFLTTNDLSTTIRNNADTSLNITVTRATPALEPFLVYQAGTAGALLNIGTSANAGTTTTVGLAGAGLPTSGSPVTISGGGITINRTRFGTFTGAGGGQVVVLDITIAANAVPGARTMFVTNGSQRAAIAGALEIIGPEVTAVPNLSVVSAANYQLSVAQDSIVSVFGSNLASATTIARTNPLPTELSGAKIIVRDSAGTERQAPLFYVSATQLNFQIPPGTLLGGLSLNFFNNNIATGKSSFTLERLAPSIFAATGSGRGAAAGSVLRVRANGQQVYENLATYNTGTATWQTVPADWSNATDKLFLVLYGTGIRYRSALTQVTATVGGKNQSVLYAGAQGSLVGLDQINIQLNRADVLGRGELDVIITTEGKAANTVRASFK